LQFPRQLANQSSDRRALLACIIEGRLDDRHLVRLVEKVERFAKLDREVVFVAGLERRQHRDLHPEWQIVEPVTPEHLYELTGALLEFCLRQSPLVSDHLSPPSTLADSTRAFLLPPDHPAINP
jgi:hypothetical protein